MSLRYRRWREYESRVKANAATSLPPTTFGAPAYARGLKLVSEDLDKLPPTPAVEKARRAVDEAMVVVNAYELGQATELQAVHALHDAQRLRTEAGSGLSPSSPAEPAKARAESPEERLEFGDRAREANRLESIFQRAHDANEQARRRGA